MTARALWQCPECGTRMTSEAQDQEVAKDGLVATIREHLDQLHPDNAGLVNAEAQATGWLAPAGHLVQLWGGPADGATVWMPPGDLPPVVGIARLDDGTLVPLRSATARLRPDVASYWLDDVRFDRDGGRVYLYERGQR